LVRLKSHFQKRIKIIAILSLIKNTTELVICGKADMVLGMLHTIIIFIDCLNPNYVIGLPKLVIVLELWVFAKNLSLTQKLGDDFLQMPKAQ